MVIARASRSRRSLRTALAAACAALVFVPASAAATAPIPADLVVDVTAEETEIGPAGGSVQLVVAVRNVGGAAAKDMTVKFEVPVGASLSVGDPYIWRCDADALKCRYGTLAAGTDAAILPMRLTLPPGNHGDTATVRATVSTTSREAATANNTDRLAISYVVMPDLLLEMTPEVSDISYFGGNGARAFVHVRVTNVGTQDAPDVRLTIQPPAVGTLEVHNFVTDGWTCDISGTPWVCTGGPVAVDGIAYLNVPISFPAGTVGDTFTMSGSAATSVAERSLTNNTDQVSFRYVTPAPADLIVQGVSVQPWQVRAGDTIDVSVYVDNWGGSPAENVTVRVPLPATVQPVSPDPSNADWTCAVVSDPESGARFWECLRPYFDQGDFTNVLVLRAVVGAGTPDGTLSFTANAQTTSPELSLENNTAEGSTTYIAEGIVGGRVWHDLDRDGQREPGEPHAEYEVGKIEFILEGTQPTWDTPMAYVNNYDGTYFQRIKPGRYVVRVLLRASANVDFTTPDIGDDATDSDILTSTSTYYGPVGESAVIEVVDGGNVVVDIGMVSTT